MGFLTRDEILGKIKVIISEHFDVEEENITETINIQTDLDADSISIMEFVLELEDVFDAEISDEDAEKIATIGAAADYIFENQ